MLGRFAKQTTGRCLSVYQPGSACNWSTIQHSPKACTESSAAIRCSSSSASSPSSTSSSSKSSKDDDAAAVQNQSFVKGLFAGNFLASKVFPFRTVMDKEKKEMLDTLIEPVDRFMKEKVDSKKIDVDAKIPVETLSGLKELGLFGLQIPEEYGGLGLSNTNYARVVEAVSMDGSIAVTLMAHQSIGLKGILLFGTDAQKQRYLPRLASGEHTAAFCLTEPTSGSDAASIQTRAKLSPDGKQWLISGTKIWISNGGICDIFTVFARTEVKDPSTGEVKDKITAFVVERKFGGITSGKPEDKLGIRGSNTTEVNFDNCPVPTENVLGDVGGGFKVAMQILNSGRFGLCAGAAGSSKKLLELAAEHARTRTQFGKKLSEFGLVQEKFANMAVSAYAMESMAYMTTGMIDSGEPDCAIEAAICKVYGSESIWTNVNEALQVLGGTGYMKSYPFERFLRDCRILLIFEGTNEILRLFIALSGIQLAGQRLKGVGDAIKNPFAGKNMDILREEVVKRIAPGLVVKRRASELSAKLHPRVAGLAEGIAANTVHFSKTVDRLVAKYRKDIIHEQLILKRLADVAIDLYGMTAVTSRVSKTLHQNLPSGDHEVLLVEAFCEKANKRIRQNLADLASSNSNADKQMVQIANDVLNEGKYVASHPLDLL